MKKITERKKKKKRPSTLRKAINRDRRKRWFEANPEVLIAKKTCLKMNMYLNVARLLKMEMAIPTIYKDSEDYAIVVNNLAKDKLKESISPSKKNKNKKLKNNNKNSNKKQVGKKKKGSSKNNNNEMQVIEEEEEEEKQEDKEVKNADNNLNDNTTNNDNINSDFPPLPSMDCRLSLQ